MLLDCRAGRPMEIEAIFGAPLRAAAGAGCLTPRIETMYQLLKFKDEANQRGTAF